MLIQDQAAKDDVKDVQLPPSILLKRLKQNHPRLDMRRVKTLQALYRGGQHILGNDEILTDVFPKYTHEKNAVYVERKKRAFYENIFALVINQISAGLAQDPVHINVEIETVELPPEEDPTKVDPEQQKAKDGDNPFAKKEDPASSKDAKDPKDQAPPKKDEEPKDSKPPFPPKKDEEQKPPPFGGKKPFPPPPPPKPVVKIVEKKTDPYWTELMENATAPSDDGSSVKSYDQVIRDAAVEALVTGWSWLQTDLPKPGEEEYVATSLAEQEKSGALRAYVVPWSTDSVTDWEEQNGKLLWVRTYCCVIPADDPSQPRNKKIHTWTLWTATSWGKYTLEEVQNQAMPNDEHPIQLAEKGTHSFGRVPWTRLDLACYGGAHLHVGDIIESLCRNYFNRANGESFQWTQYYYQQLYEFLGPEIAGIDTVVSEAQQDSARAKRTRAPGEVHVRGAEDRAEFIGPNMGGADVGQKALQEIRDAILRVVAQMALAQDTSGAMLRRSADSKRQDSVAQEIVLGALGKKLVTMANAVVKLLAMGRGDDVEEAPKMVGYENFNVMDTEAVINQNVLVEGVDIPSATYQIERKFILASSHLGDNASAETKLKIKQELAQSITQDQLTKPQLPPMPPGFDEDGNPLNDNPPGDQGDGKPPEEKPFGGPPKKPFGGGGPPFRKGRFG